MKRGCTPTAGLHTVNNVKGRGSVPQPKCGVEENMWESFASWLTVSQSVSQSFSQWVLQALSQSTKEQVLQLVRQSASMYCKPVSQILLIMGGPSEVPEYLQATLKGPPASST